MNSNELRPFKSPGDLARAAAGDCLDAMMHSSSRRPFLLAISGGRVAVVFFQELAAQAARMRFGFEGVHVFWADERCVSPEHPESNFALAQGHLLGPARIPAEQVHRIQGELDPAEAARRASDELLAFAEVDTADRPVLDLVILGMGEDGHVASLFPGETERLMECPDVYRSVVAPKPPPDRVTLGYGPILAARRVWVLASGPGKDGVLNRSLQSDGGTPLAQVLKRRNSTRILTDLAIEQEVPLRSSN